MENACRVPVRNRLTCHCAISYPHESNSRFFPYYNKETVVYVIRYIVEVAMFIHKVLF